MGGALTDYLAVAASVIRLVQVLDPSIIVLHGTVVPIVELSVVRAAQRRNVSVIFVAHEADPPHNVPGARNALARLICRADVVITHSSFVADQIRASTGRHDLTLLPLPLPVGLISAGLGAISVVEQSPVPLALLFGNLHRTYKGASTVEDLAATGVEGWRFALVGKGAPALLPGAITVGRFLERGELVATVSSSAATLLPYSRAAQSAAVVLAQAAGSVVVATSVGGIPEQVEDRVTGRLLRAQAGVAEWKDLLTDLRDEEERVRLATAARASVEQAHRVFTAAVIDLIGGVG
jgi:glycosyltransferase involved in cell wall biosynthesis